MDISTPLVNGAMLGLFTLILAWLGKSRFDALDKRMDRLERRVETLAGEIAQIRSDLLQVVLAVTPPRPQTG